MCEIDAIFGRKLVATKEATKEAIIETKGPSSLQVGLSKRPGVAAVSAKKSKKKKATLPAKVSLPSTVQVVEFDAKPSLAKSAVADPDDDGFGDSRGEKPRRKTDDGYFVYTEEELGCGKGGDTPECPFDCQCCY
ncbi:hypothetical protein HDV03_004282 [Kappamyces sp. JEL0829]|nr:hypothetical protein HDV03_004282 [Kappamyces sp. JEL0829]